MIYRGLNVLNRVWGVYYAISIIIIPLKWYR